jgi:hypothetical protein
MSMLRLVKREVTLDGIDLFRRLDPHDAEGVVSDPERVNFVANTFLQKVGKALREPSLVSGWRAQALFASMVSALDNCLLMTQIDLGEIYVDDSEDVKAPDFFLHLRSGEKILVDVKSVKYSISSVDPLIKFGAREVARMKRFGELFGAEVYVAIYVRAFPMWALVPLGDLSPGPGGGFRIPLTRAMLRSQMSKLGDQMIGTVYPLELQVTAHPDFENSVDEDGAASFTTGSIRIFANGVEAKALADQNLLHFFMQYGGWEISQRVETEKRKISVVRALAHPHEVSDQPFAVLGTLASMYARFFESKTTFNDVDLVRALDLSAEPGMLSTLLPHNYKSDVIPIWRFVTQPEART